MPDSDVLPPSREHGDVILITDASAEGGYAAEALREHGYEVFDVPLSMVESRAMGESPRVVILDIDQRYAIEHAERLRELPGASRMSLLLLGDPFRAAELGESRDSENVFARPVDLDALVTRVAALAVPGPSDYSGRGTTPPPSYSPRQGTTPPPSRKSDFAPVSDLPPMGDPLDMSVVINEDDALGSATGLHADLSPELEDLLDRAEDKIEGRVAPSIIPIAEDSADVMLPADLVLMLSEPLDAEDAELGTGALSDPGTNNVGRSSLTGLTHAGMFSDGSSGMAGPVEPTTGTGMGTSAGTPMDPSSFDGTGPSTAEPFAGSTAGPAAPTTGAYSPFGLHRAWPEMVESPRAGTLPLAAYGGGGPSTESADAKLPETGWIPPTTGSPRPFDEVQPGPSNAVGPPPGSVAPRSSPSRLPLAPIPEIVVGGQEARVVAMAIARRLRGTLALRGGGGLRRVVFSDGDIVTAASAEPEETLMSFLAARGDIDRDAAQKLSARVPAFGRHAGAALIAHGFLNQDDLWPVLRAHAEWVIGLTITGGAGSCELEAEPPARLKAEPNVFGGATGAEVFVELVRRVIPVDTAIQRVGGTAAMLEHGANFSLLGECALSPPEHELIRHGSNITLQEFLTRSPDIGNVIYGLVELEVLRATVPDDVRAAPTTQHVDPLDDDAVRARVSARVKAVRDGSYFEVLGVSSHATPYEIRRAYLDLRRSFEPSRLLNASTADLYDDVQLILEVASEAYDILRDARRKERYRRAVESGPPS